jgi:hypothetical protein
VGLPHSVKVVMRSVLKQVHVTGVEVVLANEDHGKPIQSRQIQRLEKVPFVSCPVAEKGNGDTPIPPKL